MMPSGTAAGLVFVCLVAVSAEPEELYKEVGGSVILTPGSPVTDPITTIVWKYGTDLAIEWDGSMVDSYRQFKERSSLDISDGAMRITGLTKNDTGWYAVTINLDVVSQTHLRVISPVPKPTVSASCDAELTACLLACHGDTTDAEPVTYSWRMDDMIISHTHQEYNITNGRDAFAEFSCILHNPVSQKSSDPISNPFRPNDGMKVKMGLIVFISLLAVLVMIVFIHRWKAGVWFYNTAFMPWEAGFWKRQEEMARVDTANGESSSATGNDKARSKSDGKTDTEAAESNGPIAATVAAQPEEEELMTATTGDES